MRGNLLIQGVLISYQISSLAKTTLGLHMHTLVPIKKSNLRPLYQCAQLLKALQVMSLSKELDGAHSLKAKGTPRAIVSFPNASETPSSPMLTIMARSTPTTARAR